MARGTMKTDFKGLVRLLAKNLYPEPDVFIRELIQNAHDSIVLRRAKDSHHSGRIELDTNPDTGRFVVTDNGIGMGKHEIVEYLATIGKSGTGQASQTLRAADFAVDTIGQFGVGLLSAFVVAERIEVLTRRTGSEQVWRWVSTGEVDYDIDLIDDPQFPVGTRVTIQVASIHRTLIEEPAVQQVVKRYADFLPFPIHLNGTGPVNAMNAPWHLNAWSGDADYRKGLERFVQDRFQDTAALVIPVNFQVPQTRGVLYITGHQIPIQGTSGQLDIFQERMCVRLKDTELLPDWARLIRGVIDSPDLQPTAGRDNLIKNPAYIDLRKALGNLIRQALTDLATADPRRFQRLCDYHHVHIKGMAVNDETFFDHVIELLPFETNAGSMTLRDYVGRQRAEPGRRLPVYFFSYNPDANQFNALCDAKKLVVINTGRIHDEPLVRRYVERRSTGLELKNLDQLDDPEFYQPLSDAERAPYFPLEGALQEALRWAGLPNIRPVTRRFAPANLSAAILETQRMESLERLQQMTRAPMLGDAFDQLGADVERALRERPVDLLLNADNLLIQMLSQRPDIATQKYQPLLLGVYNASVLFSAHRLTVDNAKIFHKQLHALMTWLLELDSDLVDARARAAELQAQIFADQLDDAKGPGTPWRRIFVMMPYDPIYNPLEAALRQVLESPPWFFQVVLARDEKVDTRATGNIAKHIRGADGYVAEVTEHNENVMMELGWVLFDRTLASRPCSILFRPSAGKEFPFDLGDRLRTDYKELSQLDLVMHLAHEFERDKDLKRLRQSKREHFLSETLLGQADLGLSAELKKKICKKYSSIESLLGRKKEDLIRQFPDLKPHLAQALLDFLSDQLTPHAVADAKTG